MRILVMENDEANATLFERLLDGHDVTIVRSPADARRAVNADRFDVLVVDLVMIGNGSQFVAWLQENHPHLVAHTIVATAAWERPSNVEVGYWIRKPFDRNEFLAVIAAAADSEE